MLTLNQQELQELDKFIQDMPTKYGLPLLNFINGKITEQAKQKAVIEENVQMDKEE